MNRISSNYFTFAIGNFGHSSSMKRIQMLMKITFKSTPPWPRLLNTTTLAPIFFADLTMQLIYSACESPVSPGRIKITGESSMQLCSVQSKPTSPPSFSVNNSRRKHNFVNSFWRNKLPKIVWARLSEHQIVGQNLCCSVGTFSNKYFLNGPSSTANIGCYMTKQRKSDHTGISNQFMNENHVFSLIR